MNILRYLANTFNPRNEFQRGLLLSTDQTLTLPLLRSMLNGGSPFNIPAGHQADLREVTAFYERQNAERQQQQHEYLARYTAEQQRLSGLRETAKKNTETVK